FLLLISNAFQASSPEFCFLYLKPTGLPPFNFKCLRLGSGVLIFCQTKFLDVACGRAIGCTRCLPLPLRRRTISSCLFTSGCKLISLYSKLYLCRQITTHMSKTLIAPSI